MRRFTVLAVLIGLFLALPALASPQLILQTGHTGEVDRLTYSPDGKRIASAGVDGMVKVWDASTGALLSTLPCNHGAIDGIAFIHNGDEIAVVAADGWASTWDTANATLLTSADGPVDQPEAGAVAERNGKVIVAVSSPSHSIQLWNLPDKPSDTPTKSLASLDGHKAAVTCMAFSPDGAFLASGSMNGEVKFWDVDDESLIRTVHGHAMPVRSVAFTPDGKRCIDASDDGNSDIYNVQSGGDPIELQMNRPGDGVGAAALSTDGTLAVTGGHPDLDSHAYADVWNVHAGAVKLALSGKMGLITAAAVSPDGKSIATAGVDQAVRLWNIGSAGAKKSIVAAHVLGGDSTTTFALARNGTVAVAGGADGLLRFWSLRTGELLKTLPVDPGSTRAVAATPDGTLVLSGGADKVVTVRDFDKGDIVKKLACPERVNTIVVSTDGKLIAAGCGDGEDTGAIRIWNTASWTQVAAFDNLMTVRDLAFSADGATLASAAGDEIGPGAVCVWNIATKQQTELDVDGMYPREVRGVALTPDGRRLVAACGVEDPDNGDASTGLQAIVWNARTNESQRQITVPLAGGGLESIAAGPDSTLVAAGDRFGTIRIWNPKSGELVSTLTGHVGAVDRIAFTPDGTALVTSGADSSIRVWDVATGRLRSTLIPFTGRDDWLAVTPEGYYDGSAGASRYVRWQLGSASYPLEAFEVAMHQPSELAKSLSGRPVTPPPTGDVIDAPGTRPPDVIFVVPHDGDTIDNGMVNIEVRVASAQPVRSVLLFANGRPVAEGGKPLELGAKPLEMGAKPLEMGAKPLEMGAKPLEMGAKDVDTGGGNSKALNVSQFAVSLPFKPGDTSVVLSAVAYDDAMLQGRQEVRVLRGNVVQTPGKLYVLAVGVSRYANPHFNLKYAAADADSFAGLWKPHAGGLYSSVDVTELLNDKATSQNVRAALFNLLDKVTDQDTVVLFLSGHGIVLDDGSYYFATHEIDPSTADTVAATGLAWTSFQTALAGLKAKRVLMFLDACHSGNALGNRQARSERMAEALARGSGVIVFSSCRGSEYSYELDSLGHGAFTQALIEGLGQGKANFAVDGSRASTISAEEVLAYLRIRVPQLTENQQTPSCPLLQDFGDPFPLVTD